MAYLLDKFSNQWHKGQEITRYHIAPNYWNGKLITSPMEFDLWDTEQEWSPRVMRAIQISNFFVMQNCLNDLLGRADDLLESFMRIFLASQPGSLFVVADLKFQEVLNLMNQIETRVEEEKSGVVVRRVRGEFIEMKSNIEMPELLTGDDGLIPKKNTRFYFSVLLRKANPEPDEDNPF